MTRRSFAKTVAAGVAMAAVPLRAKGKLNIGIGTYSYHNLSIDEARQTLRRYSRMIAVGVFALPSLVRALASQCEAEAISSW